jgi:hypothetical protein
MAGVRQSALTDLLIQPYLRVMFAIVHHVEPIKVRLLAMLAPATLPVVLPHWRDIPPVNPEVLTPAEARERYGYRRPAEAHLELRARQRARVFGEGRAPSDEGLVESQAVLGKLG